MDEKTGARRGALDHCRSLLFLPASNARAVAKARALDCDMVILDLEDAVAPEDKEAARGAAVSAVADGFGDRLVAVRVNGAGSDWHAADLAALADARPDFVVLPKVEAAAGLADPRRHCPHGLIAMIESCAGVLAAGEIARAEGVAGLFMGNNDLRHDLRLPADGGRDGLALALQTVVLHARAAGVAVFDGVYNRLDDPAGLEAECRHGRALGFDGKTLIHPNQIAAANAIFGPDAAAVAAARRLIEAYAGGAQRFEGRMIEAMHVAQARDVLARAGSG